MLSVPLASAKEIHTDPVTFTFLFRLCLIHRNTRFPTDFVYQFHTEDTIYYKTEIATNLDKVRNKKALHSKQYGDIRALITDLQETILQTVAKRLSALSTLLYDASSTIAEIDVISSWAEICTECGFVKPHIVDEPVVHVTVAQRGGGER